MSKSRLILIALLALAIGAFVSNPKLEDHRAAVRAEANDYLQASLEEKRSQTNSGLRRAGQALGAAFGGILANEAVDELVSVDDYFLFSTTRVAWQGEMHTIGLGLFGKVFISPNARKIVEEEILELEKK
jgi:hypothetical protein